jgi:hypothetical protein
VPFFSGYAVELGPLIDLARPPAGALAQVDLGRAGTNQSTAALARWPTIQQAVPPPTDEGARPR